MALHRADLKALPLHELPAGTELRQYGVVRAVLTEPGYARVGETDGQWSFVTAAVNEDVTARGWVETDRLGKRIE